jgi:FkbM family methyltransferase
MLTTRTKIALAAFAQRVLTAVPRMLGRGNQTIATRSGICWALDLDEGIDFSIWLLGAFERSTVAAYSLLVRPGMTVMDIGANIGAHTLPLARLVGPTGRLIAVEPTAWAVGRLRANLKLNHTFAAVVDVRQAMLVANDADPLQKEIYSSWPLHGHDVHPTMRAQVKSTAGARALTLDRLVREAGVGRIDFIKLDVDGHECAVLRGGAETLKRDHPAIILELAPYVLGKGDDSFESLIALLCQLGYRLQEMTSRQPLPSDPAALGRLIPDGGSMNVVALPVAQ